jgi:hydroxymethylpyrimidine kinase/phosphomethylpyrimidine kinase/thiamine-phosphate diphosphorylase
MKLPVVWSIAGSDSGAGAGVQADLRAFDVFDVHGCTAIAAITAQNSVNVSHVEPVATALLDAQLATLASDLPPRAVKTGLLGSVSNVQCVATWMDKLREKEPVALVIDPVWRASTGAELGSSALRDVLRQELLPRADVITPNRREAAWLLGWDPVTLNNMDAVEQAAAALMKFGPRAVVITGGDAGGRHAQDWISTPETQGWLALPRVETTHHHGSGCVFAASIAAALALGFCPADASVIAKMNTTHALQMARAAGQGSGAARPQRGFALQPGLLPSLSRLATEQDRGPFAALNNRSIGLYAVVDSAEWIERMLAAGVRTLQLRIKSESREKLSREIMQSVAAANRAQAQLFINDHWQLALEHNAYGVHLGQEDLLTADMPALRNAGMRVGLSTHSYWEVCHALAWAPSYIACGPVHATTTKDMPWLPQGNSNLAYWCRVLQEPVVAIGGMDAMRACEAIRCGAAGVAVLSGITQAHDSEQAVAGLQAGIAAAALAEPLAIPDLARSTL